MVDYWETDVVLNPQCSHGPTLLFSRKGNDRKFYVCSAFRDRKKCPFFLWQDEASTRKIFRDTSFNELITSFSSYRKRVLNLTKTAVKKSYCYTCEVLISSKERSEHKNHIVNEIVDDSILRYPTLVMKAKQQSKAESQFHFSESTINTLYSFLVQLNISAVICIGCPSIHEFILNKEACQIKSLLLDIDHRLLQFYEPNQFQMFNMYNCHMFNSDGWNPVKTICSVGKTCVIIDPPFGGRIEPLAYTLNRLQTISRSVMNIELTILLILPYFMEPAVKQSLPVFSMLDYKVEYANHRQFKKRTDKSSNRGSAVRIFTNVSTSLFVLSREEGYKYCDWCERWICNENKHCFKCETCTSKNGAPYRHCNQCGKCVKQTWKHCIECGICKLPGHICSQTHPKQSHENEIRERNFKKPKSNKNNRVKRRRNRHCDFLQTYKLRSEWWK